MLTKYKDGDNVLYIKDGEWALCPYKVKYKQHGKKQEAYTADKKWWEDFADKWDHTEIEKFEEVSWSDEEKERLEEVKDVGEGYGNYVEQYVKGGKFPDELEDEEERLDNHPMFRLQRKKEDESLGQMAEDAHITAMEQGQKHTDMDLRLKALEDKE